MIENIITIDGRELSFTPEETILDVARKNGIFIPTLCHLEGTRATGACRVCVVEIEGGRALSPACATPAANKMIVHTKSPEVLKARRMILSLLLNSGNHNCAIGGRDTDDWTEFEQKVENYDQSPELCHAHSACKLQALAYRYQANTSGLVREETEYPIEMASPLILRDFSRCILCGRCVSACNEIQVNNAISHGFRGAKAKIVAMGDDSLDRSECVFCGECIQSCPVGALVEKKSRYQIRPWEAKHVRTTCNYCGIGCQLDLHVKDDKVMKVTGVEHAFPNLGRLCVKGRFGYDFIRSTERLNKPLIRENDKLRDATWDEALDLIASKISDIKKQDGADAIAGICSAKLTNESLYLMQKLFRGVIGSNNLVSPSAAAGLNNPVGDLEEAKRIILVGCDVTEENPVAGTFIKRAVNNGSQLIVIDSHPTKIGTFASVNILVKDGMESILINGIIKELIGRGRNGSDAIKKITSEFGLDQVNKSTGVSIEEIKAAVEIIDTDEPSMLVYGPRVAASAQTFLYLQEVLDSMGKACGGLNFLGDLNNSQGACDMGLLPEYLPGYVRLDNDTARKPFEEDWGCTLNGTPGLGLNSIVNNICGNNEGSQKKIRMLYCAGEDLAVAGPAIPDITKALESIDFLVVQDILDNDTIKYADVILPSAAWGEEDGTYTNCERRVNRVRSAVTAPGEAKPAIWIFTQLSARLGREWINTDSREIWEKEIAMLVPHLRGITYSSIEQDGLQWPVPDVSSSGTEYLDKDSTPLCPGSQVSFNYHHRNLLEHCEGLLESLATSAGGNRLLSSNTREVTEKFIKLLKEEKKANVKGQIDEILNIYRPRNGGLIPVLQQVQGILGFLPAPVQNYIALGLGLPPSDVFGVVTFYSFFTMIPRGKHIIRICLGTACFVKGSSRLLETVQRDLNVEVGETTEDREYSLEVVRCIGACGLAPAIVIDDVTYGEVSPSKIMNIVESYRGNPAD